MRKHLMFVGLIIFSSVVVVASPRTEKKDVLSTCDLGDYHGQADLIIPYHAANIDHFVPMVQGGKFMHAETFVSLSEGHSPGITARVRGPTISKINLLPFIRDKNRK